MTPANALGGASIVSAWTATPPTLDGTIAGGEWGHATTFDISFGSDPVTVYLMNDAGSLYLAIDNQVDTSLDPRDFAALAFDDEGGTPPLLGDGVWNTAICPATEEGVYAIGAFVAAGQASDDAFQGASAAGFCSLEASTGSEGAYSDASGHMVYEMRIDLTASNLQAQPEDTFGAWIGCLDGGTSTFSGSTSSPSQDVSKYVGLMLSGVPVPVNELTWGKVKSTYR